MSGEEGRLRWGWTRRLRTRASRLVTLALNLGLDELAGACVVIVKTPSNLHYSSLKTDSVPVTRGKRGCWIGAKDRVAAEPVTREGHYRLD